MKFETLTAVTHLLITKFVLKLAGICMLISVLFVKVTYEWHKAIKLNYKNTRTRVIVVLRLPSTLRRWQAICYLVTSELPCAVAYTPRSLLYNVSLSGRRIGQVWRHGRSIVRRHRWSPHFSLAIISVTVLLWT